MAHQIGSTINSQSNFLFLLQIYVTRYFYLLLSNGNLALLFFTDKRFAIKKLTLKPCLYVSQSLNLIRTNLIPGRASN